MSLSKISREDAAFGLAFVGLFPDVIHWRTSPAFVNVCLQITQAPFWPLLRWGRNAKCNLRRRNFVYPEKYAQHSFVSSYPPNTHKHIIDIFIYVLFYFTKVGVYLLFKDVKLMISFFFLFCYGEMLSRFKLEKLFMMTFSQAYSRYRDIL